MLMYDRNQTKCKALINQLKINKTRTLLQVTIDDAIACDETFSILMGDMVEPRRDFITQNAKFVENLDI